MEHKYYYVVTRHVAGTLVAQEQAAIFASSTTTNTTICCIPETPARMNISPPPNPSSKPARRYLCRCPTYCKSDGKWVSRSTYYSHGEIGEIVSTGGSGQLVKRRRKKKKVYYYY